jgi:SH3-like domain-containing protein
VATKYTGWIIASLATEIRSAMARPWQSGPMGHITEIVDFGRITQSA